MADKDIKIQPGDIADDKAGQTQDGATDEPLEKLMEKFAGYNDDEKRAYLENVRKMRAEATQKFMEASDIRKQHEDIRAERDYYKTESQKRQEALDKYYEMLTSQQQPERSEVQNQPPEFDPYNPDKSYAASQRYYNDELTKRDRKLDELAKKFEESEGKYDVGMRTLRIENYLKEAIPTIGPDVSDVEIEIWARQHPDADWSDEGWKKTINQAIRERQTIIDQKVEAKHQKYLKQKEEDAKKAQETPGAPFAGSTPDMEKFLKMTPTEREEEINKFFDRGGR